MSLTAALLNPRAAGYADPGLRSDAKRALTEGREILAGIVPDGYRTINSGGGYAVPEVPWYGVLDPDVTTTAKQGIYVVYLYDAALDNVYLSLNQGATAHVESFARQGVKNRAAQAAADAALRDEAQRLRDALGPGPLVGLEAAIGLHASNSLGRLYEAGNIAAIGYRLADLPEEAQLRGDLDRMLELYQAAVDVQDRLIAANPAGYVRAARTTGPDDLGEALFRPKDAGDYLAHITARTQTRSRRHEAVVAAYGRAAAGGGWTPATNVHPRDLTLTAPGRPEVMVEVKTVGANPEHAVREALGQLFTYRYAIYGPERPVELAAVFGSSVGDMFPDMLDDLQVAAVWRDGSGWAGNRRAAALGIIPGADGATRAPVPQHLLTDTPPAAIPARGQARGR